MNTDEIRQQLERLVEQLERLAEDRANEANEANEANNSLLAEDSADDAILLESAANLLSEALDELQNVR